MCLCVFVCLTKATGTLVVLKFGGLGEGGEGDHHLCDLVCIKIIYQQGVKQLYKDN